MRHRTLIPLCPMTAPAWTASTPSSCAPDAVRRADAGDGGGIVTSNTTTATKERPILFSAPMVRAILDGHKTQTRRVIKMRNGQLMGEGELSSDGRTVMDFSRSFPYWEALPCPYGKPGDRLWVRETYGHSWHHAQPRFVYRATDDDNEQVTRHPDFDGWKSSIYMPRRASRLTLQIKDVRVERIRDISGYDALAEGVTLSEMLNGPADPTADFAPLWDAMHGKRGYGWDVNPWVWVIDFEVMHHG